MKNALKTLFSLKKFVYLKKKHYLCTLFIDGIIRVGCFTE